MNRHIRIGIVLLLSLILAAVAASGSVEGLHAGPSEGALFTGWSPKGSGLVGGFEDGWNSTGQVQNIAFMIYDGSLQAPLEAKSINNIESQGIMVLFTVNSFLGLNRLIRVGSTGFQGIFITGSPATYNGNELNEMINWTRGMGGFLVVNSSLYGMISNPSAVNVFELYQNGISPEGGNEHYPYLGSLPASRLWLDLSGIPPGQVVGASHSPEAGTCGYLSVDMNSLPLKQLSALLLNSGGEGQTHQSPSSIWNILPSHYVGDRFTYHGPGSISSGQPGS